MPCSGGDAGDQERMSAGVATAAAAVAAATGRAPLAFTTAPSAEAVMLGDARRCEALCRMAARRSGESGDEKGERGTDVAPVLSTMGFFAVSSGSAVRLEGTAALAARRSAVPGPAGIGLAFAGATVVLSSAGSEGAATATSPTSRLLPCCAGSGGGGDRRALPIDDIERRGVVLLDSRAR